MNIESGLQGRRALVTGSSSGIGFETAAMLAEAGVSYIVINGRSRHRGEAARQAILDRARNAEVAFVMGDVSSPDGARSLIESAARHLGGTIEIQAANIRPGSSTRPPSKKSVPSSGIGFSARFIVVITLFH